MTPVGFAGLSHLGLVSAAALASRGVPVIAFDPDVALVDAITRGALPVVEPGLPELVAAPTRPSFTGKVSDLRGCAVVYIALDVVTDDAGRSDLSPLNALIDAVWPAVADDAVVVLLSQVPPGFTRGLAGARRSAAPRPAALFCQVETLVFGRAVARALQPERYMIGCANPAQRLPQAFADVLALFDCPVLQMRYESAELAKISINLFLVSSISTTNLLTELCEKVGADWREIAPALRLDARIGTQAYLEPGLGFGGGNLGRDLATVKRLGAERGTDTRTIDAWQAGSTYRRDWPLRLLRSTILPALPDAALAVWGLAYKAHTASTRNSPSLSLLEALGERAITAFDPAATVPESLRGRVAIAADPVSACRGADVLLVMTPWPAFSGVALDCVALAMRGRVIVDPNGVVDGGRAEALGFTYYRLGTAASP
jgi:UDPglucose 6-dehydrogenase